MKLAFSTLGCPGWSWDEIYATAKDLGMAGIEIRGIENEMFAPKTKPFCKEHVAKTVEKLRHSGMEIPMLTTGAELGLAGRQKEAVKEAEAYINLASEIACPYIRVLITKNPQPETADRALFIDAYKHLCDYAKEKNVTPLVETNGIFANTKELAETLYRVGSSNSGVLWDIHHPYRFFGETPAQTYQNLGGKIKYIHVKDSASVDGAVQYRMMGYGDVPIFDSLKILKENGYTGFVSFEWLKRWNKELQEPGIVFSHFASYMRYLLNQI